MSIIRIGILLLMSWYCSKSAIASTVYSITHNAPLYQCRVVEPFDGTPDISSADCRQTTLAEVNPQGQYVWLLIDADLSKIADKVAKPYGLFLYAKAASRVYINGHLIGENGQPSAVQENEKVGQMDKSFFLPEAILKSGTNRIAIELSAHHGWFDLMQPMHFVGIGQFQDATNLVQQNLRFGLLLLGMLLLGILYFAVLTANPSKRKASVFFLFMALFASGQLVAEMARGLISYEYPWHDLRLVVINGLSLAFGICLLVFIAFKFADKNRWHWVYGGVIATGLAIIFTPGFDAKTTLATFIPSLVAQLLLGIKAYQRQDKTLWGYCIAFLFFLITIVATVSYFHEFWFYLIISGLLCYLVLQQTREYAKEQVLRQEEQKQLAKLEYQLARAVQQKTSETLKVTSAGKVDIISVQDLYYCQAAGDYVELYLADKSILFSGSMKSLTEQLPSTFIKIHRSYLVNLSKVVAMASDSSGGKVQLTNQVELPVSRRLMPAVRNMVNSA